MRILVTGGAGYIGSHTILELLKQGYKEIISIDNYVNSNEDNYDKIKKISGCKVSYENVNIAERTEVESFFKKYKFDAVIHFAALKSVPDSVENPNSYYKNNVLGLVNLLDAMLANNVLKIIFSSSCSVYGNPEKLPVSEKTPFGEAESPYAKTKQIGENILIDLCKANKKFKAISLRYFNPAGAHESGLIGEGFTKKPNNFLPIIAQTAIGLRDQITVFGDDYNTNDGSCVRDYIHVCDLAAAHVLALKKFSNNNNFTVYNLGTGKGTSVLEMLNCFEKENNIKVNYKIGPRRAGDVESIYAENSKSERELGWKAEKNLIDMVTSAWKWQQNM